MTYLSITKRDQTPTEVIVADEAAREHPRHGHLASRPHAPLEPAREEA